MINMLGYFHKNRGAAMVLFVLFFTFATSAMVFALGQSIFTDLYDFSRLGESKQALITSESLTEDVTHRMIYGTFSVDLNESLDLNNITAYSTTTYDSIDDVYTIESEAISRNTLRKSSSVLSIAAGSAFSYGLQAGNGGISLANSSRIIGNIYSNGEVVGAGSAEVLGDIVSAGPAGKVETIHATGSVYANTIVKIEADGDAYYQNSTGPHTILGTEYPGSPNMATTSFPISTTTVQEWKDDLANYGTVVSSGDPVCSSGTYTVDTNITLGWVTIECNLDIKKTGPSTVVTLDGPIWVKGNLSFTQGPEIRVDPSLGRRSVQILVDNPTDRLTSSQIEIRNSTNFIGSGDDRSYVMLMSFNESAETGGSEVAIDVSQSANGSVIAYTEKGLVDIGNGIDLREITGYQINVAQNTDVIYEEGLASLVFTAGPGGEYVLEDWRQTE